MTEELQHRLARIKLLALDVDGTLTDGALYFGSGGDEYKQFHAHDGLGIVIARGVGLLTALVTGRESGIVWRRSQELAIPRNRVLQGVRDKEEALRKLAADEKISLEEIAFMGDDLNDLPAMARVGVSLAPANAVFTLRETADWVSSLSGGRGAVREAIETILTARGDYQKAMDLYLTELKPGQ